jgi:hypothetical protein
MKNERIWLLRPERINVPILRALGRSMTSSRPWAPGGQRVHDARRASQTL